MDIPISIAIEQVADSVFDETDKLISQSGIPEAMIPIVWDLIARQAEAKKCKSAYGYIFSQSAKDADDKTGGKDDNTGNKS